MAQLGRNVKRYVTGRVMQADDWLCQHPRTAWWLVLFLFLNYVFDILRYINLS